MNRFMINVIYWCSLGRCYCRRVKPTDLFKQGEALDYDKEKYREMLLEAAETVLGLFGFDRSIYGGSAYSWIEMGMRG